MEAQVVIVGGGISGLSTAYWLNQMGIRVRLLEKDDRVGGVIRSELIDGFLVEHGAASTLESSPIFRELIHGVGLRSQVLRASEVARRRYIVRDSVLRALPIGPVLFLSSQLLRWRGKLRLLREPFVRNGEGGSEESVAEFARRRFGNEVADYIVDPFVSGVYAGDPEKLSLRSTFPALYALEKDHGSVTWGLVARLGGRLRRTRRKRDEAGRGSQKPIGRRRIRGLFSFARGMEALPQAIAASLLGHLTTECETTGIRRIPARAAASDEQKGVRYQVDYEQKGRRRSVEADAVVLAVPAIVAAKLLREVAAEVTEGIASIPYAPLALVALGFKRNAIRRPLDGFGFLVPAAERRPLLGTIWNSSIFPNRAPEDFVLLTTYLGGARNEEMAERDEDELVGVVREELGSLLGVSGRPVFRWVRRLFRAIPQYAMAHYQVQEAIERLGETSPGIYVTGNFIGGVSVGNCVSKAKETAEKAAAHLSRSLGRPTQPDISRQRTGQKAEEGAEVDVRPASTAEKA